MQESKFDGGLLGLIGVSIVVAFVSLITLSIATPWMVCYKERWYAKHTVINGKRLAFDGRGGQLIGKYIVWILLTIVTIGIYSLWLGINMKRWVVSHTHFEEEQAVVAE